MGIGSSVFSSVGRWILVGVCLAMVSACLGGGSKKSTRRIVKGAANDAAADKPLSEKTVRVAFSNTPLQKEGLNLSALTGDIEVQGVIRPGTIVVDAAQSTISASGLPIGDEAVFVRFKNGQEVVMTGVVEQIKIDGTTDVDVTLKECGMHKAWKGQELQGTCSWELSLD